MSHEPRFDFRAFALLYLRFVGSMAMTITMMITVQTSCAYAALLIMGFCMSLPIPWSQQ
jgi:hypothetical protein